MTALPVDGTGLARAQAAARAPSIRRLGLAQKFALAFLGLVSAVLVVNGAIDMTLSWREAQATAVRVQQEKADAAAERVSQFITEIEGQMGWTTRAEWARVSVDQRRYDFIRLLRQTPAITELIQVDGQGREQLKLSRLEPDAVGSNLDLSADPRVAGALRDRFWYGPVTFRRGSEPYMAVGIAHAGRNAGATIAEVNLKLAWDVVTGIRVGETGYAFVTDANGKLIAHPDMSLVLRDTDLNRLPQVAAAVADMKDGKLERLRVTDGRGVDGRPELSAYAAVPKLRWLVFVDLPRAEATAPVWKALWRSLALIALGVLLAGAAGAWLARRMAAPIRELQAGAQRLGEGDLGQRVQVLTQDEIGDLAQRFNVMAGRIQESQETLERRVDERTRDLEEALAQQTTTARVLEVISRSAFDRNAVFETLVSSATKLCEADKGAIFLRDDDLFRIQASAGIDERYLAAMRANPASIHEKTIARKLVMAAGAVVHVPDKLLEPDYQPRLTEFSDTRTMLSVPLMRGDTVIGGFLVKRVACRPFSDKHIALARTFADQAVIAIENARLFEEVQARTTELQASLEELRATQDRLVQTEKLASLGQLTAGIAHEIKNPLNFVNNFAAVSQELVDELTDALRAAGLDGAARAEAQEVAALLKSNLEKVANHGRRADSIVRNMLLHSRSGSGERRAAGVNALVEEALGLAYHGARAETPGFNVTLARDLDPSAGEAELFPQEITRVLLNLIGNAFHAVAKRRDIAGPGYDPTVTASTRNLGDRIEIRIRDNGTGIPSEVREKMFDPFFTTKPAGQGTGLGLSLSHDIVVKQHGGRIDVATEPGAFTEFAITLPRREPAGAQGART